MRISLITRLELRSNRIKAVSFFCNNVHLVVSCFYFVLLLIAQLHERTVSTVIMSLVFFCCVLSLLCLKFVVS